MPNLNLVVAFSAGLASFFAPCVVPLLPTYVAYVTGISLEELKKGGYGPYMKKLLLSSLFYILAFSLVFVLLGTTAAGVGVYLRRYDEIFQKVGGLIILFLGLEFAGIINVGFLGRTIQVKLPGWVNNLGYLRSFFIGITFALAWTPCVGAILGAILTLAAVTETAQGGALLLFVYSLGISLPFLIASLTLASLPKYLSAFKKHIVKISKIAGILLAVMGTLLLTGTYKYVNSWIFATFFKLGYTIR